MICRSLFITVSYNNTKVTECYINSWRKLTHSEENFLIIVDNSKKEDVLLQENIKQYKNIYYLRQSENKGYMAGCNFGLEYAKNILGIKCDSIIYTNNDITFETADFIERVNCKFEHALELAVIAPSIWDINENKELNPFMLKRPSLRRFKIMKAIYTLYVTAKLVDWISKHRPRKKKILPSPETAIYAPHGSIFILRGSLFYDYAPDDSYFLYGEEISVAEQCVVMNKKIEIDSNIIIYHHSHATTGGGLSLFTYKAKKNAINYLMTRYTWC